MSASAVNGHWIPIVSVHLRSPRPSNGASPGESRSLGPNSKTTLRLTWHSCCLQTHTHTHTHTHRNLLHPTPPISWQTNLIFKNNFPASANHFWVGHAQRGMFLSSAYLAKNLMCDLLTKIPNSYSRGKLFPSTVYQCLFPFYEFFLLLAKPKQNRKWIKYLKSLISQLLNPASTSPLAQVISMYAAWHR